MKNIVIAIILGISLIISAAISVKDRYKIIMNDGDDSGIITIKYDTVGGRTWRLALPGNYWVEVVDSDNYYVVPDKKDKQGKGR